VSAAAAKAWRCPEAELVVHLGVAITYDAITLERCAYNDASFRVPDQNAFQPSKAPIGESELFGAARTSSIDLAVVARKAGVNGLTTRAASSATVWKSNFGHHAIDATFSL